ncbi:dUTP diphosphatase [Clostridium sediminicola]|uniref:deoxyuridine 5'-triphosphate nucleotidohydrolase n=1 Tax=Clostridium sediminicola TaxID=3114879 RepID=UPI0031F22747
MDKIRGFEKISLDQFQKDFKKYDFDNIDNEYSSIIFPKRATLKSAGYDIYTLFDIELEPTEEIIVPTGIKAYMLDDEWLSIRVRSGHGFKFNIRIKNQVGVVDSDYYNNTKNEGHIFIALKNEGEDKFSLKKGEAVAQAIFHKYLLADDDNVVNQVRKGGFGSTSMKGEDI